MTKRDSLGTRRKARGRLLRGTLRKRWKLGATCAGRNEVRSAALRSRTEPPGGSLTTVDRPSRARTWTSLPSCSAVINKRGEEVEEPERRTAAPEAAAGGWFWRVPSEEVGADAEAAAVARPFSRFTLSSSRPVHRALVGWAEMAGGLDCVRAT